MLENVKRFRNSCGLNLMARVKSSALQFVLLISTIIALLISALLLFLFIHQKFSSQSDNLIKAIEASKYGVEYSLHQEVADSVVLDSGMVPVKVANDYWGSYSKIISKSVYQDSEIETIGLINTRVTENTPTFFLEDNFSGLVLAGNSKLSGNIYLPEKGVKAGSISGVYFKGGPLVEGKAYLADKTLPELDRNWRQYINNLSSILMNIQVEPIELENIERSFKNKTGIISTNEPIHISQELKGNLIINSNLEIFISSESILDQVVLVSPRIEFESGFQGSAHVIGEQIIVNSGVSLNYPSSLISNQSGVVNQLATPAIYLHPNVELKGNIIFLNSNSKNQRFASILLSKNSKVYGNIYNEGYLENLGVIIGQVYTKYMISNHRGAAYINHMYDGIIKEPEFEAVGLPFSNDLKGLAAWLY